MASPGQPLDAETRALMEPRFGYDFSRVRLHAGGVAAQSAAELNAQAYTYGNHIVFGAGQFAPQGKSGRKLIAHELTHVVQQGQNARTVQRSPGDGAKEPPKVAEARARGRAMAGVLNQQGKLSPELRARINREMSQLEGAAKDAYTEEVKTSLQAAAAGMPMVEFELLREVGETVKPAIEGAIEIVKGGSAPTGQETPHKPGDFIDYDEYQKVKVARDAFHEHHPDYKPKEMQNIDDALWKVTRNNPQLLIAYYNYYAHHDLGGKTDDNELGETVRGNSNINPRVVRADADELKEKPRLVTSNPISLLGGTLIHEYVHTPQSSSQIGVEEEAKAYGVEHFLSDRMGDEERVSYIENRYNSSKPDPYDKLGHGIELYQQANETMRQLYAIIDAGGPDAEKARAMSVDFISHNKEDYGPDLKAFLAKPSP